MYVDILYMTFISLLTGGFFKFDKSYKVLQVLTFLFQTLMARVSYETYDNMDLADEAVGIVMVLPKNIYIYRSTYLSFGEELSQFLPLLILGV